MIVLLRRSKLYQTESNSTLSIWATSEEKLTRNIRGSWIKLRKGCPISKTDHAYFPQHEFSNYIPNVFAPISPNVTWLHSLSSIEFVRDENWSWSSRFDENWSSINWSFVKQTKVVYYILVPRWIMNRKQRHIAWKHVLTRNYLLIRIHWMMFSFKWVVFSIRLRSTEKIREWQKKKMMPIRAETELAYMYFVPKTHKVVVFLFFVSSSFIILYF